MSLHETVVKIAEAMEADAASMQDSMMARLLLAHARGLKIAAAAEEASVRVPPSVLNTSDTHIVLAREEQRRARAAADAAEANVPCIREVVGGEFSGDFVPCSHVMPVGARTRIPEGTGEVYELRGDGKLHYCPPATGQ